jgi:hypothetical protein
LAWVIDVATLLIAVVLGGGGVLGAVYNWYALRSQMRRQQGLDERQRRQDYLESFRRQAESADQRGDKIEGDRIRRAYEAQEEAYRKQDDLEKSVPPDRLSGDNE